MQLITNAKYLGASINLLIDNDQVITMVPVSHNDFPADCSRFDAAGLTLFPGLSDCHAHLREPGFEYKEDINSGLTAASYGGFCNVMCMANTRPVNDNAQVTTYMIERARTTHPDGPRLFPIAAATINLAGEQMSPLAELKNAGCVAVSNDGKPVANTELVRRVMEYAADLGMIFIDHCEDPWLAKGWIMNEGAMSSALGLKGQPAAGEAIQAARDILLAESLQLPVHIAHVSSAMTVDLIAWAKSRGVAVTAETCPHYLWLTDNELKDYNSSAKVSPPLRTQADCDALRKGIANGTIDILATDHAPHAAYEKDNTLDSIPCGFIGFELALSLTLALAQENVISEEDIVRLWAKRPGEIFSLPYNEFNPGSPADFILVDPLEKWEVNEAAIHSKSCNTPFYGKILQGKVKHSWINGRKIF